MKTQLVLGFAAIAMSTACHHKARPAPGEISGDPVKLAFKFTPGEVWRYDTTSKQSVSAPSMETSIDLAYQLEFTTDSVDAAGNAHMTLHFKDMHADEIPVRQLKDFQQIVAKFVMTPSGDIRSLDVHGPSGEPAPMAQGIVASNLLPFRLAVEEKRLNEPWKHVESIPTTYAGMTTPVTVHATTEGWVRDYDDTIAHIQVNGDLSMREDNVDLGMSLRNPGSINLSNDGTFTADWTFDRSAGHTDSMSSTGDTTLEIANGDDRTVVSMSFDVKMKRRTTTN
jgi:hypothetical protein